MEEVDPVVSLHLLHVRHVLRDQVNRYLFTMKNERTYGDLAPILPQGASIVDDNRNLWEKIYDYIRARGISSTPHLMVRATLVAFDCPLKCLLICCRQI